MCVNCCAVNNITVKYRHPISKLDDIFFSHSSKLDDMLDELHGSCILSKIDGKVPSN